MRFKFRHESVQHRKLQCNSSRNVYFLLLVGLPYWGNGWPRVLACPFKVWSDWGSGWVFPDTMAQRTLSNEKRRNYEKMVSKQQ